ncbi:MAG: restriction endonuclease subunit S, partial [Chitinophagales bacterium]
MMENWKVVKLADYYKISSGLSKSADQFGSGYPFVSFKNVFWNYFLPDTLTELVNTSKKEQDKCSVKKGDVFLTRTSEKVAELGMSSVALKDYPLATFNGFTKRLRPISGEINPIFIGFYLRSIVFRAEITAYSTLTTRASLNNDIIGRLRIHLPPLSTQRKIAGILSAYDDLIENNLKRIKLLEEKARLTYEEWFVRMKFPGHENTPIDEATGLPEGWVKSKIGNIIEVGRGSSPRPISNQKYFIHGNIPWLKIADATASHIFIYQTKQYINEYGASFSRKLPIDSIVVAASGT